MAPVPQPDPAFYLVGPTGCGKTAVALALARRLGVAGIVNGDAFQLYRGIEILSAAPTGAERDAAPHHLFGVVDLMESMDAVRYAEAAWEAVLAIAGRGAWPIVVGGSGLYLKALTHGIAPIPPGDPNLRRLLDHLAIEELTGWFAALDPAGAAVTNPKNRRYLMRNLEITLLTGRPASALKTTFAAPDPKIRGVFLTRNREDLYERIDRRTDQMFDRGVIEEIRRLEGIPLSSTAERAIGLREIRAVLAGEIGREEAVSAIRQATRRYAKRQETWFRREKVFHPLCLARNENPDSTADRIVSRFPDLIKGAESVRSQATDAPFEPEEG